MLNPARKGSLLGRNPYFPCRQYLMPGNRLRAPWKEANCYCPAPERTDTTRANFVLAFAPDFLYLQRVYTSSPTSSSFLYLLLGTLKVSPPGPASFHETVNPLLCGVIDCFHKPLTILWREFSNRAWDTQEPSPPRFLPCCHSLDTDNNPPSRPDTYNLFLNQPRGGLLLT